MDLWRRFRLVGDGRWSGSSESGEYASHRRRCGRMHSKSRRISERWPLVQTKSRRWPSEFLEEKEELASDIFLPRTKLHYTAPEAQRHSRRTGPETPSARLPLVQRPQRCRLPTSTRMTALILYLTLALHFITAISAAPFSLSHAHVHLSKRQAIPDKTGNTGNTPGLAIPPSNSTSIITPSALPPPAIKTAPTTPTPPDGDSNSNDNNNIPLAPSQPSPSPGPTPPTSQLTRLTPSPPLSTAALAGLITGTTLLLLLLTLLGLVYLRRRRRLHLDVAEIPIRRSKLGSRMGLRRVFGTPAGSRSASRAEDEAERAEERRRGSEGAFSIGEKEKNTKGLDKRDISKPRAAAVVAGWLENGRLGVPRPAFMREAQRDKGLGVDEGAPWTVSKETISAPRPGRPASAEPLGRLSGMGLGMGYLK